MTEEVQSPRPATIRGSSVRKRLLLAFLILSSAGLANSGAAVAVDFRPAAVAHLGLDSFATADFDGDHRPDFAAVQRTTDSATTYWIQVRGTSSESQLIRILGPAGGLQIEARDVNGDHIVDLILATSLLRRPVAIFLNDGHGRFSPADTKSFPSAFRGPAEAQLTSAIRSLEAAAVSPPSRDSLALENASFSVFEPPAPSTAVLNLAELFEPFAISCAERAPPSENFRR